MTESDAKQKWCPMVRQAGRDGGSYNRATSGANACNCIGSDCMMWRETEPLRTMNGQHVPAGYERAYPEAVQMRKTGYCGLAGKP